MNTRLSPRELAILLLHRSPCNVQVAAVLSDKKGNIFAWGWNHTSHNGNGMHAERHAISGRANRKRLFGSRLTVAGKRRKSGNFVCAKPCTKIQPRYACEPCMELAKKYGIGIIEYVTPNGTWEILKLKYVRTYVRAR